MSNASLDEIQMEIRTPVLTGSGTEPYRCPVTATMQMIGGKWKIIILWAITNKVNRFGLLQRAIPSITKKMLASELRALEAEGLISRKVYAVVPPKVEYSITPLGETLGPVLNAMGDWGQRYALPLQSKGLEIV